MPGIDSDVIPVTARTGDVTISIKEDSVVAPDI